MAPTDPLSPTGGESDSGDDPEFTLPVDASTASGFEQPGVRIGPYRILETIGQGGMGVVYLAQQERPIRRRVALKLVKRGMDTKEVVARFEAERQALAMMDHPSIAKVYDAGSTEQGRPYFVMEHVAGQRITDYCNQHRLRLRERLRLYVQVCHAVQHAHQKAIIHRDLKPSNVLVTTHDDTPVPKVIDFGIAKATGHRLTESTVYTTLGEMIGTPEYMSPEQAEMTELNVDTRADIYSLGVMLYELLVGTLPFDARGFREAGLAGIQKILREKEPERPSTRVSHMGEVASLAAEQRRTTVPTLRKQLRQELDWITMRAMEKDRTRRYQTASEFAADIERYLRDEPVLAGPPSTLYRLRKYAKRRKGPVAAVLGVLVAIVLFGSISLWQAQRAKMQGFAARANGILASATSAKDPVVKALLLRELNDLPGLTTGQFTKAHAVLGAPLPAAILGDPEPPVENNEVAITAAVSPDGMRVAIGAQDGSLRVWRSDGIGEPVVLADVEHADVIDATSTGKLPFFFVGFSPDGKRIVTCGWDRGVRVWPTDGGKPVVLRGHEAWVIRAAFSPDGERLVTASADGTARIWPTSGNGEPIVLRGHADEVRSASFSSDGARIVTGSLDGTARVWRADGIGETVVLRGHQDVVTGAAFSPDGELIATTSSDGTARVWYADGTGKPIVLDGHDGRVTAAAFSPDGERIVTASSDHTARLWRVDCSEAPVVLQSHQGAVWWVGFSHDGSHILTASEDGTARLWETRAARSLGGVVRQRLPAAPFRGRKIRFSAKVRVDQGAGSGKAYLWLRVDRKVGAGFSDGMRDRPITSAEWREYEIVGDVVEDAYVIHLGMQLPGAGRAWMDAARLEITDGQVPPGAGIVDPGFEAERPFSGPRLVDLITSAGALSAPGWISASPGYRAETVDENPAQGRRCLRLEQFAEETFQTTVVASHGRGIRWAAFVGTGNNVITATNDGTARVWQPDGSGEPVVLRGHEDGLVSAAFSPNGERILTAANDGARIWQADGRTEAVVLEGTEGVYKAAFSPDGESIVTVSRDTTAVVRRADGRGDPVVLRGHKGWVRSAAFSFHGQHIVTASSDSTARVWRADGRGQPVVLEGHAQAVITAAFSPDGQRIVTASADGTARVWRADGRGVPVVLEGHAQAVNSAAFSPDGQRVVTASLDGTARVFRSDGGGNPVVLRGHQDQVWRAAFSPDSQRIVTASGDGTARVWRADGRGEPVVLTGHGRSVSSAAFSPDGQRVVTASLDGTARVWRVTWDGLFDFLQGSIALCLGPEERTLYLGESRSEALERCAECEKQHPRTPRDSDVRR